MNSHVVDRYELLHELGSGAFGTVYAARDVPSGQLVALKRLSRGSPAALARFKQEFRAVQGLNHPNIVRLEALIETDDGWIIAMELVSGSDLLSYVERRDGESPKRAEVRLRNAFSQLADALSGLHEHGVVHRDVKPANVRVGTDGRVVLLDFGLVTGVAEDAQSNHLPGAGTALYMAPEQATASSLTPAADWYAFGVCLYEALTGQLPFWSESPYGVMLAKQGTLPAPPSARMGAPVSHELERLCMQLLEPDPCKRADAATVHRVLADPYAPQLTMSIPETGLDVGEMFEGREAELDLIHEANEKARATGLRMLLVEGESGIGKSALVAQWVKDLQAREPDALVLRSQCYENEHSAFKAFDAGMGTLARRLDRLHGSGAPVPLPAQASVLHTLFPALASVKALQNAPKHDIPAEPLAALRSGLTALAKLLESLSERAPVVLVIDDLQWADAESFRLLRTISETTHAPRVLVLATIRPASELDATVAAEIDTLRMRMELEYLPLRGLSQASCEKLARSLLSGDVMNQWLERISIESKGHPLFVSVLCRYATGQRQRASDQLSLSAALAAKLSALDAGSRELLTLLAVAGVPCPLGLLARALSMTAEEVQKHAAELVSAKLLRRLPQQRLACFHDRVRNAVLAQLDARETVKWHRKLAVAIAIEPAHDPALLALHLEGAGQTSQAADAHHRAGDRALSALAFGVAQHHYGRAVALALSGRAEPTLVSALRVKLGHALARGGKSAMAAQQYLEACEHAGENERIDLRVWAAQHLLQSAQVEAGLAAARAVLAELDVPWPESEGAALMRVIWDRICLATTRLELRDGGQDVTTAERTQLDALWRLGMPVAWTSVLQGAALSTRHLRRALSTGEPAHAVRALAQEATFATMQKPDAPARANALFDRARILYDAKQRPDLDAYVWFMRGVSAHLLCDVVSARDRLLRAETLLRVHCPDEPWLLGQVRSQLAAAWLWLGALEAHASEIDQWRADALERNDPFSLASIEASGHCALRYLMRDDPALVRETLSSARAAWPRDGFAIVDLGEMLVSFFEALYRGGANGSAYLAQERHRHDRAFMLKAGFGKAVLNAFRANAALASHAGTRDTREAATHLANARAHAKSTRRSNVPIARLWSPLLDAQIAAAEGKTETAMAWTLAASADASRVGFAFFGPPLMYLKGLLEGGDAGAATCEQAFALAATQGWKNPRRYVAMLCPVIDAIESRRAPQA